ncbi:putative serine/threonine-protein phosphatase 6 regulatory ankyrin repeat subunit C-like [Capsicum annuum]|nr:putative serine/threonine-protein phosphatase 6 regulatory ankyrin repeat subunit C-like [Capsicum annuum]KAF3671117.1 putative serine/threonine-protein phosphatase 6 regulatory ankyrin repeat subunit C-like [Capsicum annuum]
MASFNDLYGRRRRSPIGWLEVNETKLFCLDLVHQAMEKVKVIRDRLKTAQSHQKSYIDVRRRELEFDVDDWVFLKHKRIDEIWEEEEAPVTLDHTLSLEELGISGRHVFKDAKFPISLVGPQVVEFLLSSKTLLDVSLLLPKALSLSDACQLDSLLKSAAKNGNSHCISALIEAGANVNRRDSDGGSVMSLAVKSGNLDSVQVLIESGYTIDNSADKFLHYAAAMDRVDLMEILFLGYADIDLNSIDSQGRTALHMAAIHGHVEVLQFLVTIGSDSDISDSQGWTALHFAAHQGHVESVDFLLNHSNMTKYALTKQGKTAYELATDKGPLPIKCIAEGANLNGKDQNGWTPLHRAVFKGKIEAVKVLVKHGAKLDVVDYCGYMPLHLALEAGQKDVATYLVAQGAKANLKSFKTKEAVSCDLDNHHSHLHTYNFVY